MTPEEFAQIDQKGRTVLHAYTLTFPQLMASKDPVIDDQGRMIGGADRRSESPHSRWLAWQKSVQFACGRPGVVTPEVMAYFQATKHLTSPPAEEKTYGPKFTWSPSKVMTFDTCPMKFAAESYYKTVPYEESEQSIWGTLVHRQAELFMLGEPIENESAWQIVKPYCELLARVPGQRLVEYKIALDSQWKPCEWDDGTARMILDLGIISPDGKTLKGFDWKTGKMKDDQTQMRIYAYALAILFPEVQTFDMKYIWLKDKATTGFKIERKEILPIAQDVRAKVAKMKDCWDREDFRMKKNGLCRSWCGAMDCIYNGRGR